MNTENMKEKSLSLDKVNLLSLPFLILTIGSIFSLYLLNVESPKEEIQKLNLFLVVIIYIILIVFHELIHGFFFAKYAKEGFRSVRFGIMWSGLAPYCHCKELITVQQYRVAILMPTVFLGFIPLIVGFIIGDINAIAISTFMVIGGGGDFLTLWMLRKFKKDTMVMDHATKVGFFYDE
jgi:hypothetical protein